MANTPQAESSSRAHLSVLKLRLDNRLNNLPAKWREVARDILFHRGEEPFLMAPGSVRAHHGYEGGLVEHLLETVDLCLSIAGFRATIEVVDRDLLVVMALIHDVGKVDCYYRTPEGHFDYRPADRDLHHIGAGLVIFSEARMANADKWRSLGVYEATEALGHCIVSHHGYPSHKSMRHPRTIEAAIVHYADHASAGVNNFAAGLPWPPP